MSVPSDKLVGAWLTWKVKRTSRPWRVYIVEPNEYAPATHTRIFTAALSHLLSPAPPLLDTPEAREASSPQKFDLLLFPEAFLPVREVLELLRSKRMVAMDDAAGCIHVGLRPDDKNQTHLFETQAVDSLLNEIKKIDRIEKADLAVFETWFQKQTKDKHFNLGCFFTCDSENRIRICIHPKLVRSNQEIDILPEKHLTEANLLQLITLEPDDGSIPSTTLQPLICSDALMLETDRPNRRPLDSLTSQPECFSGRTPDYVDVVSVIACTPNRVRTELAPCHHRFEWHQAFRESFVHAAKDDARHRHHHAVFLLANYRFIAGTPPKTGGLSGAFVPMPLHACPTTTSLLVSAYCRPNLKNLDQEEEHWRRTDAANFSVEWPTLGYVAGLDPSPRAGCAEALATMVAFTVQRLPRNANRWARNGQLADFSFFDAQKSIDATELQFRKRSGS